MSSMTVRPSTVRSSPGPRARLSRPGRSGRDPGGSTTLVFRDHERQDARTVASAAPPAPSGLATQGESGRQAASDRRTGCCLSTPRVGVSEPGARRQSHRSDSKVGLGRKDVMRRYPRALRCRRSAPWAVPAVPRRVHTAAVRRPLWGVSAAALALTVALLAGPATDGAFADPRGGLIVEGRSIAGLALGDTKERMLALWGRPTRRTTARAATSRRVIRVWRHSAGIRTAESGSIGPDT